MTVEGVYEKSLRHALEYVHVVATRRGWGTGTLIVTFDAGRALGIYQEHSLSISIRDTDFAGIIEGVPHDWVEIGTGFIDPRFSQRIAALLSELEKKSMRS